MKTLKIILAILLILTLLPTSACSAYAYSEISLSEEKVSEDTDIYVEYPQDYKDFLSDIHIISNSALFLMMFCFLGGLSAIVVIFSTLKKKYGGLVSGGIVLTIIGWAEINKMLIHGLEKHAISLHLIATNTVYREKDLLAPYGVFNAPSTYTVIQAFLLLPVVGLLIIGLLQILLPKKKPSRKVNREKKEIQNKIIEGNEVSTSSSDSIDQLKKYKLLLDEGLITQEEYEIKKKQLLEL